eukprot:ctg_1680.g402
MRVIRGRAQRAAVLSARGAAAVHGSRRCRERDERHRWRAGVRLVLPVQAHVSDSPRNWTPELFAVLPRASCNPVRGSAAAAAAAARPRIPDKRGGAASTTSRADAAA